MSGLSSIPLKANTLQPGANLKIKCTNGRNIKQRVGGTKTFLWSDDGPRWISLRNAACHPLNHSSASEARPTISEKCPFPGGNRSLFSKFIEFLNKNHLQSLRIPTNVLSFWNQQELEKPAVPDKTSCCTDSSLCSPSTPPLILIKHMALATYVGTTSPSTVFEPVLLGWGACAWNRRASGTLRLMVSTWWKGTMFVSLMT